MPSSDISKCNNTECKSHLLCYRFTCPAGDERTQSWVAFKPSKGKKRCNDYMSMRGKLI